MRSRAAILVAATLLLCISAAAQIPPHVKPHPAIPTDTLHQLIESRTADIEIKKDRQNQHVVYKGLFSYQDMETEPTFHWLPAGMDGYTPDAAATAYVKQHIQDYALLIFIGTWCGDSREHLPHLFRTLRDANIQYENLMMIGMDREKTTISRQAKRLVRKYKVELLPTFILIDKDGREAGRITEAPGKSVEADLAAIMGLK